MSGKGMEHKVEGKQTGGSDGRPMAPGARREGSGNPHPPRRASLSDGEIRDLLGNFAEQVGAYFG